MSWNVEESDGVFKIVPQRKRPDRGWEDDTEQTITFPPGTGVNEVCDRMIAILQAAAQQ